MTTATLRQRIARGRSSAAWQTHIHVRRPPVERREFWATQALVLGIAALHAWTETRHLLGEASPLYLVPATLYLIPCLYAAVKFGARGALLTAVWSAFLVILNVLMWHEGFDGASEVVQIAWIGIAAVFVGKRVDGERAARHEAEARESDQRVSEERYRAIMDNVDEPIIVLDSDGDVVEANESAARLFGDSVGALRGRRLPGATGVMITKRLDDGTIDASRRRPLRLGQPARWFELVAMATKGSSGAPARQLLLRDVTESVEREQGLESITRQALATREEEQQRIARELHDGPLQSLVQLWRALDSLANEVPRSQRAPVTAARVAAEDVANELRRFSRDLRPSVLDDLGISAAIRSEAESLRQRADITVQVRVEGRTRRLEEDVEVALLRITQEAVRNIERHSSASEAAIELDFGRSEVRLVISDDGHGMDHTPTASELMSENHLGLVGMQERARLVGGRLDISSAEGGGLRIEARIPVGEIPH